jgi:group I intron endonuclease
MLETIKNFPNKPGIYKITSPTDKVYIGEAEDLRVRCSFYLTPNRIKKQRGIYNSLIKHSVENHKIEIIEYCDVDELLQRERFWQEHFNSVNEGLNCFLTKTDTQKKVLSEETKKIMSQKASGVNNHFYGKKHSEESKLKISERSSGENNPNYGGKFKNDEWLMKQRISNSKKHLKVIDTLNNEEYVFINSKDVANFLSCDSGRVRTSKKYGWRIYKRYIIEDLITET